MTIVRDPTIVAQATGTIPFSRSCSLSTSAILRIPPLIPGPPSAANGGDNFGERYHTVDGGRSYGIEHGSPVPSKRLPAGISRIKFVHLRNTNRKATTSVQNTIIRRVRSQSCLHSLVCIPPLMLCTVVADYSDCSTYAPKLVKRVAKAKVGSFTAPSNEFTRVYRHNCGVSDRPIVRTPELDCHCCHIARSDLDQVALS